jgi:hypothetical protein
MNDFILAPCPSSIDWIMEIRSDTVSTNNRILYFPNRKYEEEIVDVKSIRNQVYP